MSPAALLVVAFLLGFALPGILLVGLVHWRARTLGAAPFVIVVVFSVSLAALLSVTLGPLAQLSALGAWWAGVLLVPVVEEIGKGAGVLVSPAARSTRRDAMLFGAIAGLSFAMVENLVYVLSDFLVAGPESAVLTAAYRAVGPVALHVAASALVGEAVWTYFSARAHPRALALVLVAIALHGASNALGALGLVWPLALDLVAVALVGWRGLRASGRAALSPRPPLRRA